MTTVTTSTRHIDVDFPIEPYRLELEKAIPAAPQALR